MPRLLPSHNRSREPRYLRLLKRRQRTSLLLEGLAGAAVGAALVCFIAEQVSRAALAWWLGMGFLLLALFGVLIEAIDEAIERRARCKRQAAQDAVHPRPEKHS